MKLAVVGGGISGMSAAHHAQDYAEVTLFEANASLGGHSDTHHLLVDGHSFAVDSGFIVFNEENYPLFSAWLNSLGVSSIPTSMSFAVSSEEGVEYGTTGTKAIFCQPRNLVSPRFLSMLREIHRFYQQAVRIDSEDARTVSEFIADEGYKSAFAELHLIPMCAAIWSAAGESVEEMPIGQVANFFVNHGLTRLKDRPQWHVVEGGSASYIEAFERGFKGRIATACPVRNVSRDHLGATLVTDQGSQQFDGIIFACHSDEALGMLDATAIEREILQALTFSDSHAVLHSDASVMPRSERAWSSWNVYKTKRGEFEFSYGMNQLQQISAPPSFFVTLNPKRPLTKVWVERHYRHPVFSLEAVRARKRRLEISGKNRTSFCGAYWGWGFHEDGFRSGVLAAQEIRQSAKCVAT